MKTTIRIWLNDDDDEQYSKIFVDESEIPVIIWSTELDLISQITSSNASF